MDHLKKINNNYSKGKFDKFLCYCSQVSHVTFENSLNSNNNYNISEICDKHNIGKKCSACLANVEEFYLKIKGEKSLNLQNFELKKITSVKKLVLKSLDFLSGNMFVIQNSYLPVLNSNSIKTWLIISNYEPSQIFEASVPYKIHIDLYNSQGTKVNSLNKIVNPGLNLKICFQDLIKNSSNLLETYFAMISRKPLKKGFRGSIRPHFFYQSKKSMAAVHAQDGASKKILLDFYRSINEDNYFLFVINPNKEKVTFKISSFSKKAKSYRNLHEASIFSMGSKLLKINDFYKNSKEGIIECKALKGLKHYLIIADKKLERFSVDHL